jgi:hypothetical protein
LIERLAYRAVDATLIVGVELVKKGLVNLNQLTSERKPNQIDSRVKVKESK